MSSSDTSGTCDMASDDYLTIKCKKKYDYSETDTVSYTCETDTVSYICESETEPICYEEKSCHKRRNFPNPDVCLFRSIITPLSSLTPVNSKNTGPIEFRMRRKNKVVSLQWEPFSGIITTTGISYLMLAQTICNMPPYSVYGVYNIQYNGVLRQCPIEINPATIKSNVLFYLNSNGTAQNVNANDSVIIKGGCIQWVVA